MPTYVFKCPKCGLELEQLMSMGEFAQTPAPMCCAEGCDGQQRMRVQLQPAGLVFKGTGWTPKHYKKSSTSRGAPTDILTPKKR